MQKGQRQALLGDPQGGQIEKKKMEKVETQDVPSRNEDLFITI